MGLVFTRPIFKDGGSPWLSGTPVVDAKMLTENFQLLFESYNAKVHGSNVAIPGNVGQINEGFIQWQEFFGAGSSLGSFGRGHSHDGIDSEVLAIDAITASTTNYGSFGAWQFPADGATQVILYGSVLIDGYIISGTFFTFHADVPHDPIWWGYYDTAGAAGYLSYGRPFVQLRSGDTLLNNKVNCISSELVISPSSPGWIYLACTIEMATNTIGTNHEPIYVDWMIVALAYRSPA